MLRTTKNLNNLFLFLICLIEITLIVGLLPIYFQQNDDTGINAIASGAISGKPSEYLLFTNVMLGYVLKFLFTYFPTVNWYTWYLLTALFMGYFAIQYSFATLKESLWLKAFKHVLILTLLISSIISITFTEVAAVVMIAGILLITVSGKKNYLESGFGVFLMVLGALIRADVFNMMILLGVPLFVYLLYKKRFKKLLFIFFSVLLSFGANMVDEMVYNNIDYKEYREFNQLRSRVTASDNSQLLDKMPIFKEMGWSIADVELIANFNLDVGHLKFTKEKLEKVGKYGPGLIEKMSLSFLFKNIEVILEKFFNFIVMQTHWLLVFCCMLFLFIEHKAKGLLLLFFSLIYLVIIALLILIIKEGILKLNITFGLLFPLGLLLIFYLSFDRLFKLIGIVYVNYLKIGLIVFCVGVLFVPIIKLNMKKDAIKEAFENTTKMHAALEARPESFYVSWVVFQYYPIFNIPFNRSKAYSLGWMAGSPANKDKIERYTGNRNLGVYTIFNKDIVWYFQNDVYYNLFAEKVYNFYLSNYPQCNFEEELIAVTDKKKLIKHTYHIKM